KTCIFSHPVYLFLREFSLQDSRGGSTPRWRNYLFLISARLVRRNQQLRRFFAY
ncbi:ferritin, partial [Escherichia coli]